MLMNFSGTTSFSETLFSTGFAFLAITITKKNDSGSALGSKDYTKEIYVSTQIEKNSQKMHNKLSTFDRLSRFYVPDNALD